MILSLEEEIIGSTSGAVCLYIEKVGTATIGLVYLNDLRFEIGETVRSETSGISGTINDFDPGDENIIERFTLDSGQRETICDLF